jgi:hypothetical protein
VLRWGAGALTTAAAGGGAAALLAACGGGTPDTTPTTVPATTAAPPTTGAPTTDAPTTAAPTTVAEPPTAAEWSALAESLTGTLILPSDSRYPVAVQLYDSRFDAVRPAAVAYGADAADIARCIDFARSHALAPIPRSGGHSYGGYSTGTGLVIDVTSMAAVQPTASSGGAARATIGAGALLIDVYNALNAAGVSIPGGSCPTVGIAGLTLGGGIGVVGRRYGLASDQLVSVQLVTADGRMVTADAGTNADLFWACRGGGGGNLGIVTSFTFSTFPTADVTVFDLAWPWAAASQVLPAWLDWAPTAPEPLWSQLVLETDPTAAAPTVTVAGVWQGSPGDLVPLLDSFLASAGTPSSRYSETVPFAHAMFLEAGCAQLSQTACRLATQTLTGAAVLAPAGTSPAVGTLPRGANVAKSDYLDAPLGDAGVAAVLAGIQNRRDDGAPGAVGYDAYGGALNAVAPGATAFVHRNSLASAQYSASYPTTAAPADLAAAQTWLDGWYQTLRPYVSGAAYQNYIDPDLSTWATAYYGANLPRLEAVKARWDPDNTFRFAQSIPLP